ncbi:glycoside hydrolase family 78 protein [Pedobacter sandarakinus]|uniref:glycoside hydrolase family 78 protein n=1 Tax=Pedobacter sandarakinus TaxID=353156 RepID=UPI00224800CE|nr:glycoside hydrolase family 78 protein [Pedobacter sandarakinus]MCX2575551.1 glycoside hydrolase family 78 protein [Pedobacter sandarakinus]
MSFLRRSLLIVFISVSFFPVATFSQKIETRGLTVEHLVNPLSIDSATPRFSWKLVSTVKNTTQTSYEIRLGTSPSFSKKPIWISKKTNDQSVLVPYTGSALLSKTKYYWQVRVSDNHGNKSAWSPVQFFQTGLKAQDWLANWITVHGKDTVQASPMFRKEINITKAVRSATAYITGKGLYEASLNGSRISNHYFAPGWTSYKDHLQYQVYDVTNQIAKGKNAIGVMLGDGWYKGRIGFANQQHFYGDTRALLFQLEISFSDGTKSTFCSDSTWKMAYGPIMASNIYDGETYDARKELGGWNNVGFNANDWKSVRVIPAGSEKLVGMSGPPVTKHEIFKAQKLITTPKGERVIDFGQNLVGWVMVKAAGERGKAITISHAEVLDKAGNFYTTNLRSAKQQNKYILKGGDAQVFAPHFSFQGFRYIKVEGFTEPLHLEDFNAVALYSDMTETGQFSTSNALLNQLQHNIQWGQKGNFVDVPTDCPQRDERLGWTGDAQAFAATAAYNMDVAGFFSKWLKDVSADQHQNGSVPYVIPDVLKEWDAGSAGWADVATIIPWDMYVAYGNKGILEQQYSSMQKWVDYVSTKANNHLWNSGSHFGDWLFYRPNDDNDGRAAVTDKYMIAQCFYGHSLQLMINTAKVLGKEDDVAKYENLLKEVKLAYLKEYVTPNGKLVSNTQTAYVLALQFDMLPEELRAQAALRLVANIKDYGNHLTTGFLGTPYLCHVLSKFGHDDVAYDLLMQQSYPSWLYPVTKGATTIWERWDGLKPDGSFQTADMNSFNHYAYGAVGDWMYKNIAGIMPIVEHPGYKMFSIAPKPGGKLTSATATFESVYGSIKSSWAVENGIFKMDVVIPANSSATIIFPTNKEKQTVGSGTYHFESKY